MEPETLRTIYGELRSPKRHHLLAGVLSTRMWIKQRNDEAETALSCYAEPLAAMSSLLGGRDLRQELWQSWRYLLQNHAHDSICGCGIDEVHGEMQARFAASAQIAEMVTAEGLGTLARHVQIVNGPLPRKLTDATRPGEKPPAGNMLSVIVFNPTGGPRTDFVSFSAPKLFPGQTYRLVETGDQFVPMTPTAWQMPLSAERDLDAAGMLQLLARIETGWLDSGGVTDIHLQVQAKSAELDLTMLELGKPDMTALFQFAAEMRERIAAGEITRFRVRTWLAGQASAGFIARDVPGHGYRTYGLKLVDAGQAMTIHKAPAAGKRKSLENRIENEFFRVEVNRRDGTFILLDKRRGRIFRGLNRFQDGGDRGDEYTYCPPARDQVIERPAARPFVSIHDASPVGWRLEVAMRYRVPARLTPKRNARSRTMISIPILTRVWLRPGIPRVDIETTVDNRAEDHRLCVLFPTPFHTTHSVAEGHFDLVTRRMPPEQDTSDWVEQPSATAPQRGFVTVHEGEHGLLVANRGLPEYELVPGKSGTTIALTLLRCIGWLSRDDLDCRQGPAGPTLATPGAQCPGVHTFAYSLIPFARSITTRVQEAHAFRAPLRSIVAPPGDGRLPEQWSFVELTPVELVITAIKPAEDGDGCAVRFWNSGDQAATAHLKVSFDIRSAQAANLLEESQADLEVRDRHSLELQVRAKQIVTVRLRLK